MIFLLLIIIYYKYEVIKYNTMGGNKMKYALLEKHEYLIEGDCIMKIRY